ncbi:MAG: hypothetical protein UY63_C0013G0014 [Parcubacteria group bacterium GW2011_GWA2_51_10]|nr:MAG: hypothetical protein UY63_C0013G0014 [Parcubacteria group bacterium GW2011_GWA2_51_10]
MRRFEGVLVYPHATGDVTIGIRSKIRMTPMQRRSLRGVFSRRVPRKNALRIFVDVVQHTWVVRLDIRVCSRDESREVAIFFGHAYKRVMHFQPMLRELISVKAVLDVLS